jgi:putative flippase GtrA
MIGLNHNRAIELLRYYQAGIVNAAFGYAVYAILVSLGLGIFVAQMISQVLGISFNFLTYSRHVFRDSETTSLRFVSGYAINYLISLCALFAVSRILTDPFLCGALAIIIASVVNYVVLRRFVFKVRKNS